MPTRHSRTSNRPQHTKRQDNQKPSILYRKTVTVDPSTVGGIIGKGGRNIQAMARMCKSGCRFSHQAESPGTFEISAFSQTSVGAAVIFLKKKEQELLKQYGSGKGSDKGSAKAKATSHSAQDSTGGFDALASDSEGEEQETKPSPKTGRRTIRLQMGTAPRGQTRRQTRDNNQAMHQAREAVATERKCNPWQVSDREVNAYLRRQTLSESRATTQSQTQMPVATDFPCLNGDSAVTTASAKGAWGKGDSVRVAQQEALETVEEKPPASNLTRLGTKSPTPTTKASSGLKTRPVAAPRLSLAVDDWEAADSWANDGESDDELPSQLQMTLSELGIEASEWA